MPDRYKRTGLSLTPDVVQQLDDIAGNWEQREVGTVSRSQVAREALSLGLACLEVLDEPEFRRLHSRERKGLVRQALLESDDINL